MYRKGSLCSAIAVVILSIMWNARDETVWASPSACPIYPDIDVIRDGSTPSQVIQSKEIQDALKEVDILLNQAVSTIPTGLVATVVFDQTTMWTKGYGWNDASNKSQGPPTRNSLVRIASITKVFTSVLLYAMRDRSLVSLHDPLDQYLANFSMKLMSDEDMITLRELASHTSGMPRELPYPCSGFDYQRDGCNETKVLSVLRDHAVVSASHRRFHYSNLGFALLGRALAHALSVDTSDNGDSLSYEALIARYVTEPLGMTNATFAYNDTTKERSAKGTTSPDGTPVQIPDGPTCGFEAPAGCLWASASDMERLMKFLFRIDALEQSHGRQKSDDPFDASTIAEIMAPVILLRNGFQAIGTPFEMEYILGKYWTKGKQGELPGYRSSVTVIEDLKLGVFTSAFVSDVEDSSVWTLPILKILAPALDTVLTRSSALPSTYKEYLGRYYDGSVTVSVVNETNLIFVPGNDATPLRLVSVPGLTRVLRAVDVVQMGCRWLDDGTDQELVRFLWDDPSEDNSSGFVRGMQFMGAQYDKIL